MVKTLPSSAGGVGLIPDWGAKISHPLKKKTKTSNTVANSIGVGRWSTLKNI